MGSSASDSRRRETRNAFEQLDKNKNVAAIRNRLHRFSTASIKSRLQKERLQNPARRIEFNQWFAKELWGAEWARADALEALVTHGISLPGRT